MAYLETIWRQGGPFRAYAVLAVAEAMKGISLAQRASFRPETRDLASAFAPMVDAVCSGLWAVVVLPSELAAIPFPKVTVDNGLPHNALGPAAIWERGETYWFWRGVRVPRQWIRRFGAGGNDRPEN